MSWKTNARKIPRNHLRKHIIAESDNDTRGFRKPGKRIEKRHGKPFVIVDHVHDSIVKDDESGKKYVANSINLRRGQYLFPKFFLHKKKKFVGEVKDIQFKPEKGWIVYLDGVLRDFKSGDPILFDGQQIDCSGWYLESDLLDAKLGIKAIKPSATAPSEKEIIASREDRIRRESARMCA